MAEIIDQVFSQACHRAGMNRSRLELRADLFHHPGGRQLSFL
jgi:hypothetical protein